MNKTKKQRLSELFEKWRQKQHNESDESLTKTKIESENITKDHFCADGIIDESIFEKEAPKVLFISNESNANMPELKDTPMSSRVGDYRTYYDTGRDTFGGKLLERTCVLYKTIINNYAIPEHKVAKRFAFMNLNKRGGGRTVEVTRIEEYVKQYKNEILEEISIIDPDIIAWLGTNTFFISQYLGAYSENGKVYLSINDKKIPVLKLPHPSCYRLKNEPMEEFTNKIHGKHAARMAMELEKYGLNSKIVEK